MCRGYFSQPTVARATREQTTDAAASNVSNPKQENICQMCHLLRVHMKHVSDWVALRRFCSGHDAHATVTARSNRHLSFGNVLKPTFTTPINVSVFMVGSGLPRQARKRCSGNGTQARSRPSSRMRLSTGLATSRSSCIGNECVDISGWGHCSGKNTGERYCAGIWAAPPRAASWSIARQEHSCHW